MDYKTFFPVFRDCILGLSFIHKKSIIHRDIKAANVLKLNDNAYVYDDFGEGLNLSYECKYLNDT